MSRIYYITIEAIALSSVEPKTLTVYQTVRCSVLLYDISANIAMIHSVDSEDAGTFITHLGWKNA